MYFQGLVIIQFVDGSVLDLWQCCSFNSSVTSILRPLEVILSQKYIKLKNQKCYQIIKDKNQNS